MSQLLAALAALFLFLAIPIDFEFSMARRMGLFEGSASLVWLFGLVRLRLKRQRQTRSLGKMFPAAQFLSRDFLRSLKRLFGNLLHAVRILDLSLKVRLGFDDPADTGRFLGMVGPLIALFPAARIVVEPEFSAAAFDAEGRGLIRIFPFMLLKAMLLFALSPATLRAFFIARRK